MIGSECFVIGSEVVFVGLGGVVWSDCDVEISGCGVVGKVVGGGDDGVGVDWKCVVGGGI